MLNEQVRGLTSIERFLYFIKERQAIYEKKERGLPKPWTDDEVLRSYFFCNVYREQDKVTKWFKHHIREPLRDGWGVIMATIIFRWFNLPATAMVLGDALYGEVNFVWEANQERWNLFLDWDAREALRRLKPLRDKNVQIFTGAYMINSPGNEKKLEAIVRRIDQVWQDRNTIIEWCKRRKKADVTMEGLHSVLTRYEGLGGFMAYEVICDLRWTHVLENAPDKMTWCNPGPGAIRGLYRVFERDFPKGNNAACPPLPKDWTERTQELLDIVQNRYPNMPTFEMREIEHCLCELDKYDRLLFGDGRAKRRYKGA